jgi:hypothetical protein
MTKFRFFSIIVPLISAATTVMAAGGSGALVVTASNATTNQLLVYTAGGALLQTLPTGGQGGIPQGSNAGGVQAMGNLVAVINYGSLNVSMFALGSHGFEMTQLVPTIANPVSVAFGDSHLYILGTTEVESHRMDGPFVSPVPDGEVALVVGDGSAAQVGVLPNQLIITEKSNMIETVNLIAGGGVGGVATPVSNIPANINTPLGLVTSGSNAYVTIAHANEISLVRNGAILTVTNSGTQNAPCWLTLVGSFLFSSNSPSMSVSRYAVFGQRIVQVSAVAATFNGDPTDIASNGGWVTAIAGSGSLTYLSIFSVDQDGNLTLLQPASTITGAANGVAIIPVAN